MEDLEQKPRGARRGEAFRALVVEAEFRARRMGVAMDRRRFPGRKRDLLAVFRKVLGESASESSMEEYMRSEGIKFLPGQDDDTLRHLFREHF
jgi:hypothetical protein